MSQKKSRKWSTVNSENSYNVNYHYKRHLQHTERTNSLCLKRNNQIKNYIKEEKSAKLLIEKKYSCYTISSSKTSMIMLSMSMSWLRKLSRRLWLQLRWIKSSLSFSDASLNWHNESS